MRLLLASTVFCVLAGGLTARDDQKTDAKKYESKEGKFRVGFPGKPALQTNTVGETDIHITVLEKGKGGFGVIYSDMPAAQVKAAKSKDLLDGGEKGLAANTQTKITSSKDIDFGPDKLPGRDIVSENDKMTIRVRIILADNRLYQVMVVGPNELATGKDADKFVDSFEIIK